MEVADEFVDLTLMFDDEGGDVRDVEELRTLCLGDDEPKEETQTDPAVEGEPADYEDGPGFEEEGEREEDEVDLGFVSVSYSMF